MGSFSFEQSQLSRGSRVVSHLTLKMQSDERLVELVRVGCEPAFEAIVERYRWSLLRYCGRVLGPDRAQDAVQQTFISAYTTILDDGREIQLKGWLYRIAHNTSLKILEKKGWNHEALDENYDGVARPPELVEQRQRLDALVDRIHELPDRQRSALLMHEFEGRSYKEIANRLSGSVPVVRELIYRARTSLRNSLGMLVPLKWIEALMTRVPSGESSPQRVADLVAGARATAGVVQAVVALVIAGTVATGVAVKSADHGHKEFDRGFGAGAAASAVRLNSADVVDLRAALRAGGKIGGSDVSSGTKPHGVSSNKSSGRRGSNDAQNGKPQTRTPESSALAPTEGDSPSARRSGPSTSTATDDSGNSRGGRDGSDDSSSKSGDGKSGRDSETGRKQDRGSDDHHSSGPGDDDRRSGDGGDSSSSSGPSSSGESSSSSSGSSGGSGSPGSGSGSGDSHHGDGGHNGGGSGDDH